MEIEHIILCVDDDQDDLDMLRMVIERSHETYRMETARDGAEALERLEALKALHKLPCLPFTSEYPFRKARESLVFVPDR